MQSPEHRPGTAPSAAAATGGEPLMQMARNFVPAEADLDELAEAIRALLASSDAVPIN